MLSSYAEFVSTIAIESDRAQMRQQNFTWRLTVRFAYAHHGRLMPPKDDEEIPPHIRNASTHIPPRAVWAIAISVIVLFAVAYCRGSV